MKAKTVLEKMVVQLGKTLKPISEKQLAYGFDKCFIKQGVFLRKKAYCLECGYVWQHKGSLNPNYLIVSLSTTTCPCCSKELTAMPNGKRTDRDAVYYGVVTKCQDFQVFRILILKQSVKTGRKPVCSSQEVMQHWVHTSGEIFLRSVQIRPMTLDGWMEGKPLELRSTMSWTASEKIGLYPYEIYPTQRLLAEVKRNGHDGTFYGVNPTIFFSKLLGDPEVETLLKAKQYSMLSYLLKDNPWGKNDLQRKELWNSVKICIRNKYIIQDASIWIDYVKLLAEFGKDLLNSHFVCPVDLTESHNKLSLKKQERQLRKKLEQRRNELVESQKLYAESKAMFFGIAFSNGDITVKVLETVEEFMKEGDLLKHCVFNREYYKKPESLILSARVGDTPVETVEINLKSLQIIQARGWDNKPSPYHGQVIELVTQNLPTIGKLLRG